jgi:hypothetical protein
MKKNPWGMELKNKILILQIISNKTNTNQKIIDQI